MNPGLLWLIGFGFSCYGLGTMVVRHQTGDIGFWGVVGMALLFGVAVCFNFRHLRLFGPAPKPTE